VRGEGLLIALQLTGDFSAKIAARALDAGFIVNAVNPSAIRLAPPLNLSPAQIQPFLDFIDHLPQFEAELETEQP
jgi:acetylornithine aminotransferase